MLLCDIGNTSYHFYDESSGSDFKREVVAFAPESTPDMVYYINVNPTIQKRLDALENWVDLRRYVRWERYYDTMGIDRIMACEAIDNGVIVDAGSAITVDVVSGGCFEGGFIVPGVRALREAYAGVSAVLDTSFNFDMPLDKMPKNTRDAVTYGAFGMLAVRVADTGLPIYLTGGDAALLRSLFAEPRMATLLLFAGMKKTMQKAHLC